MKRILLVDDEQNVLNALQRELRGHFEVEAFDNPLSALERSREVQFDLVISDYKMPDMNGLEFLKAFELIQPDTARMVLSGQADIDALIRAINETHIYRFIAKPWEKSNLLLSIGQALAYQDVILQSRLQKDAGGVQVGTGTHSYRIVLVESNEYLLGLMSRRLTDENGCESLYGAMQYGGVHGGGTVTKFNCVVDSFRTGAEALDHALKNDCDLIIASQTLPDMDGIHLLSQMKKARPDVARILISSEPSKTALSQAINEVEVQSLLQLHWDNYELRADVRRQAWNLYQLKMAAIQALGSRALMIKNIEKNQ